MALGHERLNVYRLAICYVAWVCEKAGALEGVHRAARDQWLRTSQSIPLNIAEGNGKTAEADRRPNPALGQVLSRIFALPDPEHAADKRPSRPPHHPRFHNQRKRISARGANTEYPSARGIT